MNVLEKILEEIENIEKEYMYGHHALYALGAAGVAFKISNIIRSYMNEGFNTSVTQWIPYTVENMPKKEEVYLVTCDDEKYPVKRMRFKNGIWLWHYGIYDGKILAYQPLPDPYKPEEDKP